VFDGGGPQLNFSSSLRSWKLNNPIRFSTKLLFKRVSRRRVYARHRRFIHAGWRTAASAVRKLTLGTGVEAAMELSIFCPNVNLVCPRCQDGLAPRRCQPQREILPLAA
jgi:hypothetical protein